MKPCLAILGPTASGKTQFALALAKALDGEIVCLDSTTVYKGFDVGTAKPTAEDQKAVAHHLIDLLEPEEEFTAHDFVKRADVCLQEIESRNKVPIVVGGTFFYFKALQNGMFPVGDSPPEIIEAIETEFWDEDEQTANNLLHQALEKVDPVTANKLPPTDRYRLLRALAIFRTSGKKPSELKPEPLSAAQQERLWMKYALLISRHTLVQNISTRTQEMLKNGLVEETQKLRDKYPKAKALQSVGYQECVKFLEKELSEKALPDAIIERTRQLAKRQTTWSRSDTTLRFVDPLDLDRVVLEYKNLSFALQKGSA